MKGKNHPKFLKIRCTDCGNEQIVYSHASTPVKCNVCGKTLTVPQGGKARLRGAVIGPVEGEV
jgi:small subunit ribosomal protein S27e